MKAFSGSKLLLLAIAAVLGCSDGDSVMQPVPAGAVWALADASTNNRAGFNFRPPLAANVASAGVFDGTLSPVVEICELAAGACAADIASFSTTTGSGSEMVRVDPEGEQYTVNWNTERFPVRNGALYRISVLVSDVLLGHVDVVASDKGKGAKAGYTGGHSVVSLGSTLPIKFRIEAGIAGAVVIDPTGAELAPGETQQFTITVTDLHGNPIAVPVTWGSSDAAAAAVNSSGLVTGVAGGTAVITGSTAHGSASATVEVVAPSAGAPPAPAIASGAMHSCALNSLGSAFCWGSNTSGRLGNGTSANSLLPVAVSGGLAFSSMSVGDHHSCGLATTGQAHCWGAGMGGRLGDGLSTSSTIPVAVAGGHLFSWLATGTNVSCGLDGSGAAHCWGFGASGELGNGTIAIAASPVAVSGGLTFASLTSGAAHVCGVTPAAAAYCWGSGMGGRLGNDTFDNSLVPSVVSGGISFASLSAGEGHTCGIDTGGAAWCWGSAGSGQLGNGSSAASPIPVAVLGGLTFTSVSAGGAHTCALTPAGEAYCWGNGGGGRLGNGAMTNRNTPVAVSGGIAFTRIDAGVAHTCGMTAPGQYYCWGTGNNGQLGNGTLVNQLTPMLVSPMP